MLLVDFTNHFTPKPNPVRNVRISSDSRTLAATLGEPGKATEAVWWNLADNAPVGMSDIYPPECREYINPKSSSRAGGGRDYGGYTAYSRTFSDPVFFLDLTRCVIHGFSYGSGSVVFPDVVLVAPGVSYKQGIGLPFGDAWESGVDVLAISADGHCLLANQGDGRFCQWDLRKVKFSKAAKSQPEVEAFPLAPSDPEDEWAGWDAADADALALSAEGKLLATGHTDGEVKLFDLRKREQLAVLQPPTGDAKSAKSAIRGVQFSANDKQLAVWSAESVTVFEIPTGTAVTRFKAPKLTGAAFHPEGTQLLTASLDKHVRVWDAHTGREVKRYDWKIGPVHSVAVSPDGLTAAAGGEKNQAVVWDLSAD